MLVFFLLLLWFVRCCWETWIMTDGGRGMVLYVWE